MIIGLDGWFFLQGEVCCAGSIYINLSRATQDHEKSLSHLPTGHQYLPLTPIPDNITERKLNFNYVGHNITDIIYIKV